MSAADAARAMLELFAYDASRWTQEAEARDISGNDDVSPLDGGAACWCVYGAARRVLGREPHLSAIDKALERLTGEDEYPVMWNDDPDRTFADVVDVLERIAAGEGGTP